MRDADGLTPWVVTQRAPLVAVARRILDLKAHIPIVSLPPHNDGTKAVVLRIDLPNGVSPEVSLQDDGAGGLRLHFPRPPGAPDPLVDPTLRPNLVALLRLFRRRQRAHGPDDAQELWAAVDALGPLFELDDRYYRRVVPGVHGLSANLRLGFRCNQDCHFCWQGRRWPGPPETLHEQWLDELGELGVKRLVLTGGEPTLYRGLGALLRRARERYGMLTMLQTNAVLLSRRSALDRLVSAGVDRLFVSLHAADPDISDGMTRAPGTWTKTVAGVEAALGAGLRVGLSVVVERANRADLPAHARMVRDRFVTPFPDNPVESVTYSRPQTYFDPAMHRASIEALDVLGPPLREAVAVLSAAGVVVDLTTGSCAIPACVLREYPEHITLPPVHMWAATDRARARGHAGPEPCQGCALAGRCGGPGPGYVAVHGTRGLRPFDAVPDGLGSAFTLTWE